jgi:hypothetical protein
MSTWTINAVAAAALGVSGLRLTKNNQAADTLTFTLGGDYTAELTFTHLRPVTLARAGQVVFRGVVTAVRRAATPNDEAVTITVSGPWWQLENTIFMQKRKARQRGDYAIGAPDYLGGARIPDWLTGNRELLIEFYAALTAKFGDGWSTTDPDADPASADAINGFIYAWLLSHNPTEVDPAAVAGLPPADAEQFANAWTAHVVLCQQLTNEAMDTAAQLAEIVDYAAAAGAPLALGDVPDGVFPPFSEGTSLTCAQAISQLLRWTPDAVTWFDYGANPPLLHCTRRAAASAVALAVHDGVKVSANELVPRHDLLRAGVVIIYSRGNDLVKTDTAPAGVVPQAVNVAVMTIELGAGGTSFANYHVDYAPINVGDPAWWRLKIPKLKDAEELEITAVDKPGSFIREVVGGSFPPGINGARTGTITGVASYTLKNAKGALSQYEKVPLSITLNGTNFVQQDWAISTGGTAPEPVPVGLAAELWAAISELQYDGAITLAERECNPAAWQPGQLLNLTGGRPEWAAARAQLQAVAFDLDTGQTTLTLGPGPLLAAEDLVELMRAARQRVASQYASIRVGGTGGGAGLSLGGKGANTANSDSEAFVTKRVMVGGENDAHKITHDTAVGLIELRVNKTDSRIISLKLDDLATSDLALSPTGSLTVKLRKVKLCNSSGKAQSAYLLMSELLTDEE